MGFNLNAQSTYQIKHEKYNITNIDYQQTLIINKHWLSTNKHATDVYMEIVVG